MGDILHSSLTGAELHGPKVHESSHRVGGSDSLDWVPYDSHDLLLLEDFNLWEDVKKYGCNVDYDNDGYDNFVKDYSIDTTNKKYGAGSGDFTSHAPSWTFDYLASDGTKPDAQGWGLNGTDQTTMSGSDYCEIDTLGTNQQCYYTKGWTASNAEGWSLEANLQMINSDSSGYFILSGDDGTKSAYMQIYTTHVLIRSNNSNYYFYFDTTDTYHTYRITVIKNVARFYIDNVLIHCGAANTASNDRVYFGDNQAIADIEVRVVYANYYEGAAIPSDAVAYYNRKISDIGSLSLWFRDIEESKVLWESLSGLKLSTDSNGYLEFTLTEQDGTVHTVTGGIKRTDDTTWRNVNINWQVNNAGSDYMYMYYENGAEGTPNTSQTYNIKHCRGILVGNGFQQPGTWTDDLDMSVEPNSAGWTLGGSDYASVSSGILTINTLNKTTASNFYYKMWTASNTNGWTIEAKMRVIESELASVFEENAWNNSCTFKGYDGNKWEGICFFNDGILINNNGQHVKHLMNTTSEYHVYRISVRGTVGYVYVDGALIAKTTSETTSNDYILFGDSATTTGDNTHTEWEFVRYYQGTDYRSIAFSQCLGQIDDVGIFAKQLTALERTNIQSNALRSITLASSDCISNRPIFRPDGSLVMSGNLNMGGFNIIHSGGGTSFVPRGNMASPDFSESTLTTDGNAHDLDLSTIIPYGVKLAKIQIILSDDSVGLTFRIRNKGFAGIWNTALLTVPVANQYSIADFDMYLPKDRILEYIASNTTWTAIGVTVRGWWT